MRRFGFARIGVVAIAAVCPCFAQPSFAVASIKPTELTKPTLRFRVGPDTFTGALTLKYLIQQAYDVEDYQVAGGPPWLQSERFDVQAKAESAVSPEEIRGMLRNLLAERFELKFHRETRTMPGYILSVDKGGSKLSPPKSDVVPGSKGSIQVGGGEFWAHGASIKNLAKALTIEMEQPVIDQTMIAGNYDFRIRFDEGNQDLVEKPDAEPRGSIFAALRELGLRLEARKVEIEVLVIDSAHEPSGN